MSNLLALPIKTTYQVEFKDIVRGYLHSHATSHPDEFKDDVQEWHLLRRAFVAGTVHQDRVNTALVYHAQLLSICTKLPNDIPIDFPYAPVFDQDDLPITLQNLTFERASVLFNLAALYSQSAATEDRATKDGIKRALAKYQHAAGTFSYLTTSVLPNLVLPSSRTNHPTDLTKNNIKGLEYLMLAQAQECSWQAARMDNYKNGLVSRISAKVSALYGLAHTTIREASPSIQYLFPPTWLAHIEAKQHHFDAVAQYRKSVDDTEAHKYGHELARLQIALTKAKKAYDIARKGKIVQSVIRDIESLLEVAQKSRERAERDNDLIYHQDVPIPSELPQIAPAELAKSVIPAGILDPSSVLGARHPLFERLMGWGAREAINIYITRRDELIQSKVVEVAQSHKDRDADALRRLNLPASLEALERPVGLPPSLLAKAEEVRLENGPDAIETSLDGVERLAQRDYTILNEAMDILDGEASEDEAARKTLIVDRPPSHQANVDLVEKEKRYRDILNQAASSDEIVRQKWDEWEANITELTWNKDDLEAAVPSSTISLTSKLTAQASQTQVHARKLRGLLDEIKAIHRQLDDVIDRAKRTAGIDEITERILKMSNGFEKFAEVQPAMFEDVMDNELAKYDRFPAEIAELERKQSSILKNLEGTNNAFLMSRKDDPAVREREHALQSLDLAYHKYREIRRNLDEGYKFYNDLAAILLQFKEACKAWSHERKLELQSQSKLNRTMQSLSLRDEVAESQVSGTITPVASKKLRTASNPNPDQSAHKTTRNSSSIVALPSAPSLASPPTSSNKPPMASTATIQTNPKTPTSGRPAPGFFNPRKTPVGKSALGLPAINLGDWDFEDVKLPPPPPHGQR